MLPGQQRERNGRSARRWTGLLVGCGLVALTGCDLLARLRDPIEPEHAGYATGLRAAGLAETPLGRAWLDAGPRAVTDADAVTLPHRRDGWFAVDAPAAVAVRFAAPAERWVSIRATLASGAPARLFMEAFRIPRDTAEPPVVLATAPADADAVSFRVRGREDIVVRIQPELLRGGTWTLEVSASDDEPEQTGER